MFNSLKSSPKVRTTALWLGSFCLLSMSWPALAAEAVAWKTYLFSAMAVALVIGAVLAFRNPKAESLPGKLLLTGLYFWVITFAELILLALIFYLTKK